MEQAGNALINTIISRQKQLEGDVSFIKREQCAHSNQIETLAIEVQEIRQELGKVHQKIDDMQGPINKINKLDHEMSILKQDVKLILEALAIKY